jgi:tight adherence protein B
VGDDLRALARAAALGMPLPLVLHRWPTMRPQVPHVRAAAVALAIALEQGGSAARAVDDVAHSVRASHDLAAEAKGLATHARASALLVAALPVAFLVIAAGIDPPSVGFLVATPLGRMCLVAGLALDAAGWWWMRRIVLRAQP